MPAWLSAFAASASAFRATADKSPRRRDISPELARKFRRERRRMKEHAWKAKRASNAKPRRNTLRRVLSATCRPNTITGHLSRRMLEHCSHIRIDAKRQALDALDVQRGRVLPEAGNGNGGDPQDAEIEAIIEVSDTVLTQRIGRLSAMSYSAGARVPGRAR